MASLIKKKGGKVTENKTVQLTHFGRPRIPLGNVTVDEAKSIVAKLDRWENAKYRGIPCDQEIEAWLRQDHAISRRLAELGLTPARQSATLQAFLDGYVEGRTDVKPNTRLHWEYTIKDMVKFFGAERRLESVTPADADDWKLDMGKRKLSADTVAKRIRNARQFFRRAEKAGLIPRHSNPFSEVKATATGNRKRRVYISGQVIDQVIEACPDTEWKVIFALARYGGLRTPS